MTPPSDEPGAEGKFGSAALKVNNRIFAMLVRGELVVKLPRRRVDALMVAGDGRPFDTGRGRVMKEWVSLDPRSRIAWLGVARESMEFVRSAN